MIKLAAVGALMLASAAGPAFAADDGFHTFWKSFSPAIAKGDRKALAGMVKVGPELGEGVTSFKQFYDGDLGPRTRACLAKTKPERVVDGQGGVSYYAYCGPFIYIFSPYGGGWMLDGISPDD